jgi:hypothetical protein
MLPKLEWIADGRLLSPEGLCGRQRRCADANGIRQAQAAADGPTGLGCRAVARGEGVVGLRTVPTGPAQQVIVLGLECTDCSG